MFWWQIKQENQATTPWRDVYKDLYFLTSNQPESTSFSWNNNDTKQRITYENFIQTQYKYQMITSIEEEDYYNTHRAQNSSVNYTTPYTALTETAKQRLRHSKNLINIGKKRVDNYLYSSLLARPTLSNEPVFTFDTNYNNQEPRWPIWTTTQIHAEKQVHNVTISEKMQTKITLPNSSQDPEKLQIILCRLDHTEEQQYHNPTSKFLQLHHKTGHLSLDKTQATTKRKPATKTHITLTYTFTETTFLTIAGQRQNKWIQT
jgi:hypothetical protein